MLLVPACQELVEVCRDDLICWHDSSLCELPKNSSASRLSCAVRATSLPPISSALPFLFARIAPPFSRTVRPDTACSCQCRPFPSSGTSPAGRGVLPPCAPRFRSGCEQERANQRTAIG